MKGCPRLAALAVCFAWMVPHAANAYYVESRANDAEDMPIPLRFNIEDGMPVEYRLAADIPDDHKTAIEAAFATWSAVECSAITFMRGPDVETPDPYHWQTDEGARYILVYEDDEATLWPTPRVGFFQFGHDIDTSTIIGVSIIINTYSHAWSTTGEAEVMDMQGVMTALIGRSIGISSAMEGNATYPSYAPGDTSKRTLGAEDLNAIKFLYGDDTCGEIPPPDAICTGDEPAGMECPPTVSTGGGSDGGVDGDGGTGTGGSDGGGPGGTLDAGTPGGTLDSGTPSGTRDASSGGGTGAVGGDDDDGCSCSAPGRASRTTAFGVFFALGYVLTRRRRPRKAR